MKKYLTIIFTILLVSSVSSQSISVQELIANSIAYHDPDGLLMKSEVHMDFVETRPGGEDRESSISFDIQKEFFQMNNSRDGLSIESKMSEGVVSFYVDGKEDFSEELAKKYRLTKSRIGMMKNYYEYLWLMPLKLNDPGTKIDPEVKKVDFFGKESLAIRVTYSEEVGKDIWYFYFDPSTYAMHGYRFYHDESKNDGEYILLEGETVNKNVRIPKSRTWYTHKDDKLLGTDILEGLAF